MPAARFCMLSLVILNYVTRREGDLIMNAIRMIVPYKYQGMWVFDDERVGLHREPFVAGADVALDLMTADIPNAASGFVLLFSDQPFPGYQYEFHWKRPEYGGNWYYSPQFDREGWLCPALLRYFEEPPKRLYVQVKPRS